MPATPTSLRRGGRRGRRTSTMVRIARERIDDLFALAERESGVGTGALADRYVRLARKVGTRYNVRLLREYRELYCRGCSAYWVEGRTVRTRLRGGHRVRTCLRCGRTRRVELRDRRSPSRLPEASRGVAPQQDPVLVGTAEEISEEPEEDERSEEA
ncbi:MAG: ribonuclease P protein component 4 [Thermoplasmata archaeon]